MTSSKALSQILLPEKNLQLVQMLRGIASVLVILLHITFNSSTSFSQPFLFNIFKFGGAGVDIFFVLSGFIITYSNLEALSRPNKLIGFLKRRFIRIFPIYWIVFTFFLLLQLIFSSFYKTPFSLNLTSILKTWLLLPGHMMINGVSWSLTNELYFYLLFSLAILIPIKKIVAYFSLGYFIFLIVLAFGGITSENVYIKLLIFPMNIEFFLGVLIAIIIKKIPTVLILYMLIIGISAFVVGAYYQDNEFVFLTKGVSEGLNRVVMFGLPSSFIIAAFVKWELSNTVIVKRFLLQLGDASYAIYLIHLPIVAALFKIMVVLHVKNSAIIYIASIIIIFVVCFLGIIVYKNIEKPLIKKCNNVFLKSKEIH